jgi:nickel-type superoxide dismutase maturation protease
MKSPISRYTVDGNSMTPTFYQGQDVVSFNWAYLSKKPKVGEIVVLNFKGKDLIKRVVKVEGENIFIEGDNKDNSTDSRDFGPIKLDQIKGKVVYATSQQIEELIPCLNCDFPVIGIYGRKDALCKNCGFKLACCGEP